MNSNLLLALASLGATQDIFIPYHDRYINKNIEVTEYDELRIKKAEEKRARRAAKKGNNHGPNNSNSL